MSFPEHGLKGMCILSANGSISNVTLRQSSTSGGTVTYEVSENQITPSGALYGAFPAKLYILLEFQFLQFMSFWTVVFTLYTLHLCFYSDTQIPDHRHDERPGDWIALILPLRDFMSMDHPWWNSSQQYFRVLNWAPPGQTFTFEHYMLIRHLLLLFLLKHSIAIFS